MDARQLLVDTHPHLPPAATLAGITAALGWPEMAANDWPAICERFLEGLDTLAAVVAELEPDGAIQPPIEFPMLASYTARDVWEHVAQHNAYHLGQIVVLRQVLGIWPPPAGSYTW